MRRLEDTIQKTVFQHLKMRAASGVFAFAVPNGGRRNPIEAAIMKATGTKAGVPDICIIKGGHSYFLELKAPGRKTTEVQDDVIAMLREAGATVAVAVGLDAAIQNLEAWGLLKGAAATSSTVRPL